LIQLGSGDALLLVLLLLLLLLLTLADDATYQANLVIPTTPIPAIKTAPTAPRPIAPNILNALGGSGISSSVRGWPPCGRPVVGVGVWETGQ
jgi:hypothetical protein